MKIMTQVLDCGKVILRITPGLNIILHIPRRLEHHGFKSIDINHA